MHAALPEIRAESDEVYRRLAEVVASGKLDPARRTSESQWSSAQVYGHLARWLEMSEAALARHIAGKPQPPAEDEDALNSRWAAEDASLSEAEAIAWCEAARANLFAALTAVPPEAWDRTADLIARDDTIAHPRAHIDYLGD